MHLRFDGALKNVLLHEGLPNKRVHSALLNVGLQMHMDQLIGGAVVNALTVSPNVSALLKEARVLDGLAYHVWVATVASELVLNPAKYAEEDYTVPWEGVS